MQELITALLPSPQRCLDLIHQLLPQLASEVYQAFIAEVHEATRKLSFVPTSPEEFADLLAFLEKLELSRHSTDEAYDHVSGHVTSHMACAKPVILTRVHGSQQAEI